MGDDLIMSARPKRLPLVFRAYFIVIGLVRPASNVLLLYSNPLDVIYASYGLAGFALLIYQVFLYPILILVTLYSGLREYLLYIVIAALASEVAMLLIAVTSPGLLVTGGYALFTIMNIMILALSVIAYMLSSRPIVSIQ